MMKKALVIEDDEDLAFIFSEAVKKAGFLTETCLDGAKARQLLEQFGPDLIVLDLHLPNVHGVDLLHHIRGHHRLAFSTIIIATADPLLADLYRDQADIILIKPISFNQLRDLAARLAA